MEKMIVVKDLCKEYNTRKILSGLSFEICQEEAVAITGPSGSGKSTILNILGLLEGATSGQVMINGKPAPAINSAKATQLRRYELSYLFQSLALLNDKTVYENVEIGMTYIKQSKAEKKKRILDVFEQLDIAHVAQDKISILSGGEQQRAAIARAILKPGNLILADEPTGSLDRSLADTVFDQLLRMTKEHHKTLIIVTHDPQIASRCNRILELSAWR